MAEAASTVRIDESYRLTDRYERPSGRIYVTGTQALVRIMLAQAEADRAAGRRTAGLVSGYRGSPLGAVDQEFWRAAKLVEKVGIRFQPAINEDLAATIVLGSQQAETDPERTVDGVFAMWYGKGPGVDRSGDALKHGNAYGSSPTGGVLVVAGDDHGCTSSSMSHQSDLAMVAWRMPVIHPASIREYVEFGLWGFALSRFSGNWVGFKAISETVEGTCSVELPSALPAFAPPADHAPPPGGLHYRWPDLPSPLIEARLEHKLDAVRAFARLNPLDRHVVRPNLAAPGQRKRLVIVTAGKAHLDVMECLRVGGLDADRLAAAGVGVYKVGLVFPIERHGLAEALDGAEEVLVVEEKAAVVETQIKELLFNLPGDRRPRVVGKTDEDGRPLVPATTETRPSRLAPILAARLKRAAGGLDLALPRAWAAGPAEQLPRPYVRPPYFCSGCPHNTSTRVPEGSTARAGIGCHFMANWMDRDTSGIVQMGGEGVDWVGLSTFTGRKHVFQNLGDGTFFHSGHMAIRQAVAAGANVTFKVLFNDAVAMTGGQPVEGKLSVPQITRLAQAEGARRVVVVTDEPEKYPAGAGFAPGTTVHHRDELDAVQRELREIEGVTVLVYDQTCAAEKRRRRKRNTYPDPPKRVVINELVCEGCGDCQKKSNCLSVVPVDTEFGRKRRIDQSSCNKDFSCIKGFCPSFVTVEGGALRRGAAAAIAHQAVLDRAASLPVPALERRPEPREILVAGVGGTGIVTVGVLIVMAAHLEGQGASVVDFMGFAQKGGPVMSHVRVAGDPSLLHQVRIDRGRADVLIAADLVVATDLDAVGVIERGRTTVVANTHEIPTGAMLRDRKASIDTTLLRGILQRKAGDDAVHAVDAQHLAERLIGDSVQANILLLGFAWQKGLIPVSLEALDRALALNGVAVEANRRAFAWGRLAAGDPDFVAGFLDDAPSAERRPAAATLDEIVARRVAFLTDYQDADYAGRYRAQVERVRAAERKLFGREGKLSEAVARNLFKLMAYKDEYEVARLYTDGSFAKRVAGEFEGPVRLTFHLAPPLLSRTRPGETEPRKMSFGPWMMSAFKLLARLRRLRGTALDPFGWTEERRLERRLIDEYVAMLDEMLPLLSPQTYDTSVRLAALPEDISGFGPVKLRSIEKAAEERRTLMAELRREDATAPHAA
jgi:indolepyruvate ferredoxin oxidoreductase